MHDLYVLQKKNPNAMSEYQQKLAGIWKRNNCHPLKSVLPILVQAPVFIGFFTSLQSLALAKVNAACSRGALQMTLDGSGSMRATSGLRAT